MYLKILETTIEWLKEVGAYFCFTERNDLSFSPHVIMYSVCERILFGTGLRAISIWIRYIARG